MHCPRSDAGEQIDPPLRQPGEDDGFNGLVEPGDHRRAHHHEQDAEDQASGRARLQQSVVSLSSGASVTTAALDAGYQSPSAFIAAYKRTFGVTPARWRAAP